MRKAGSCVAQAKQVILLAKTTFTRGLKLFYCECKKHSSKAGRAVMCCPLMLCRHCCNQRNKANPRNSRTEIILSDSSFIVWIIGLNASEGECWSLSEMVYPFWIRIEYQVLKVFGSGLKCLQFTCSSLYVMKPLTCLTFRFYFMSV